MAVDLSSSQALKLLHDVNLALLHGDKPDLTLRQLCILLAVYLDAPPHTVRGLAVKLGVTKPVISRALDTMAGLGLVSRRRDQNDRRNVLVQRTVKGALYLENLGDVLSRNARDLPA